MNKEEIQEEINKICKVGNGCHNKVDQNGDCSYISYQGNLRVCSSCHRKVKALQKKLQEIEEKEE